MLHGTSHPVEIISFRYQNVYLGKGNMDKHSSNQSSNSPNLSTFACGRLAFISSLNYNKTKG